MSYNVSNSTAHHVIDKMNAISKNIVLHHTASGMKKNCSDLAEVAPVIKDDSVLEPSVCTVCVCGCYRRVDLLCTELICK